jgi:hypothetical protein
MLDFKAFFNYFNNNRFSIITAATPVLKPMCGIILRFPHAGRIGAR